VPAEGKLMMCPPMQADGVPAEGKLVMCPPSAQSRPAHDERRADER
jgi:hypothetical protein